MKPDGTKYPCLYPLPNGSRCAECDACQNPDYKPTCCDGSPFGEWSHVHGGCNCIHGIRVERDPAMPVGAAVLVSEGRPATRVGNVVIIPGGNSRALTLRERFRLWRGLSVTIDPATTKPTPTIHAIIRL